MRAGVNVGASREYSDFTVNMPLLERLAGNVLHGGQPGKVASVQGQLPFATEAGSKVAEDLTLFGAIYRQRSRAATCGLPWL